MKLRHLIWGLAGASAATLAYGTLVEARRLVLERRTLRLPHWPARLRGYRIALLADFHLRDAASVELAERAVAMAIDERPDMVVIAGDFVSHWKPEVVSMLGQVLEPMLLMNGAVVAVPGNHEYFGGSPRLLAPIFNEFGIRLLRNDVWRHGGIQWVGVDSANAGKADPFAPMAEAFEAPSDPAVVVWHEPDLVDWLPRGAALMLSGHSHGGQFTFPWGWTPMHTRHGEKYVRGFYPAAPTPLYVTRGVGTTLFASRLGCPPEVALLTLEDGSRGF